MFDTVFLGPSLGGGQNFFKTVGGFYNKREYSEADWLVLLICSHYVISQRSNIVCQQFREGTVVRLCFGNTNVITSRAIFHLQYQ